MVWLGILIVVSLLQACGMSVSQQVDEDVRSNPYVHQVFDTTYIHPDFVDTVDQFQQDCTAAQLSNVRSITYADIQDSEHPDRVGVCYFGDEIQIHNTVANMHPALQRQVLYHELGHCLLDWENHVPLDNGIHIMNAFVFLDNPEYYEGTNWDRLVHNMCH